MERKKKIQNSSSLSSQEEENEKDNDFEHFEEEKQEGKSSNKESEFDLLIRSIKKAERPRSDNGPRNKLQDSRPNPTKRSQTTTRSPNPSPSPNDNYLGNSDDTVINEDAHRLKQLFEGRITALERDVAAALRYYFITKSIIIIAANE